MTATNTHGLALVYHDKAMDLWSISANLDEYLVYQDDERRAALTETVTKRLEDLDATLQRYTRLKFSHIRFHVHPKARTVDGSLEPARTITVMPVSIHGNRFILTTFARNGGRLDARRVLATLERVQASLDEVRKVTLVRGVNFIQQDQVLQHHANRFLQHAETELNDGHWSRDEGETAGKDFVEVATTGVGCHVDQYRGDLVLDQEADMASMITPPVDEDLILEYMKVALPPAIAGKVASDTFTIMRDAWRSLSTSFQPSWRGDLIMAFLRRAIVAAPLQGCDPFSSGTGDLQGLVAGSTTTMLARVREFLQGLEARMDDMDDDPAVSNPLDTLVDAYTSIFGSIDGLDAIMGAIKDGLEERVKTAISPGTGDDIVTIGQVTASIGGFLDVIKDRMAGTIAKTIQVEAVSRCARAIEKLVDASVLDNEKGVVHDIGKRMLTKANKLFLDGEIARINDGTSTGPVIDAHAFKERFKDAVKATIASFLLEPAELVKFASNLLDDEEQDTIQPHVAKFLALERDVAFLKEHLLEAGQLGGFLEKHAEHFYDPKSFARQFNDFSSKGLDLLPLEWTVLVPNWFSAFSNVFQVQHAQAALSRARVVEKFMEFLDIVAREQSSFENIFSVISTYVGALPDSREKRILLDFLKRFEQSQQVQGSLPGYFEQRILAAIDDINIAGACTIDMASETFTTSVLTSCHAELVDVLDGGLIVPGEMTFHLDDDAQVGFTIRCTVDGSVARLDIATNWFSRVVE